MAKKGLPAQGSDAILKAMSEANEMMLKKEKEKREQENKDFRKLAKGK